MLILRDLLKITYQLLYSQTYVVLHFRFLKRIYIFNKSTRRFTVLNTSSSIDHLTADEIFVRGSYSLSQLKLQKYLENRYDEVMRSGKKPLIIDCGANIGISSAYFGDTFPNATIVAIEPDVANYALCVKNTSSFPNIEVRHSAISSRIRNMKLTNPDALSNEYIVEAAAEGTIKSTTIDNLIEQYNHSVGFIVKIDIEGGETDLFSSNTDWIDECDVIMIELHDWLFPSKGTSANFLNKITKRNRDFVINGENIFSIRVIQNEER